MVKHPAQTEGRLVVLIKYGFVVGVRILVIDGQYGKINYPHVLNTRWILPLTFLQLINTGVHRHRLEVQP